MIKQRLFYISTTSHYRNVEYREEEQDSEVYRKSFDHRLLVASPRDSQSWVLVTAKSVMSLVLTIHLKKMYYSLISQAEKTHLCIIRGSTRRGDFDISSSGVRGVYCRLFEE